MYGWREVGGFVGGGYLHMHVCTDIRMYDIQRYGCAM